MENRLNLIERRLNELERKVKIIDTDLDIHKVMSDKRVDQIVIGKKNQTYKNGSTASSITGIEKSSIYKCLRGEIKTAGGFEWIYTRNK